MPNQPNTIRVGFSHLCGSDLVKEWSSNLALRMQLLSASERDALVKRMKRRYWFGKMTGTDGKERWCIGYQGKSCELDC